MKNEETVWVLVDCISTFRMRYMVQAPKSNPEYALDDVTMGTAKEFSQEWLGEQIVSSRTMTTEEALAQCDIDNAYCSGWTDEQKIKAFFTKEGEQRE